MDVITQRFIAIGNKLLAELRLVRTGIQQLVSGVHDAKGAQNQQQEHEPPVVRAELQIPEAIERETREDRKKQYKVQVWLAISTSLAFIAAAIYAGIAALQWKEMMRAANAAASAAETAKETLHTSERAYIMNEAPELDPAKKAINVLFVNTGRIPSGEVEIVTHEATFNSIDTAPVPLNAAVERHWKRHKIPFISPAHPFGLLIPIPSMDLEKLNTGHQKIEVVGFISYNDGFPKTDQQLWLFCEETVYHAVAKQIYMVPCDAFDHLPKFESLDGYSE